MESVFLSYFCVKKKALKLFELFSSENAFDLDKGNSIVRPSSHMFTWEEEDEDIAILRKSRASRQSDANMRMSKRSTSVAGSVNLSMSAVVLDKSIGNPML